MLKHLEPSGLSVDVREYSKLINQMRLPQICSVVFRSIVKDLEELKMSRFGVMTHLKKPRYL